MVGTDALWLFCIAGLKAKPRSRPDSPSRDGGVVRVLARFAWFSTEPGLSFSCDHHVDHCQTKRCTAVRCCSTGAPNVAAKGQLGTCTAASFGSLASCIAAAEGKPGAVI